MIWDTFYRNDRNDGVSGNHGTLELNIIFPNIILFPATYLFLPRKFYLFSGFYFDCKVKGGLINFPTNSFHWWYTFPQNWNSSRVHWSFHCFLVPLHPPPPPTGPGGWILFHLSDQISWLSITKLIMLYATSTSLGCIFFSTKLQLFCANTASLCFTALQWKYSECQFMGEKRYQFIFWDKVGFNYICSPGKKNPFGQHCVKIICKDTWSILGTICLKASSSKARNNSKIKIHVFSSRTKDREGGQWHVLFCSVRLGFGGWELNIFVYPELFYCHKRYQWENAP